MSYMRALVDVFSLGWLLAGPDPVHAVAERSGSHGRLLR